MDSQRATSALKSWNVLITAHDRRKAALGDVSMNGE